MTAIQKAKLYTERYLILAALVGGSAWAIHIAREARNAPPPPPNLSQDYLYEQQQNLSRELNTIQQQLKLVIPE